MAENQFIIGEMGKSKLRIDIPKLIDSRALVQANSGGGKSWLLRLIAEQACKKVQVVILDPEGEFHTLREKFDFALAGRGGEVSVDLRTASLLSKKIIELGTSIVVDLSSLDSLSEKREYVSLFLTAMIGVPRSMWHPMLVMVDEAHKFAPEKGKIESSDAIITLMDSGRKRGFGGILATQRLSKLSKDAAAEANVVFVGRTVLDVDQDRAGDVLGFHRNQYNQLRDLEPGSFFSFGPALSENGVIQFTSGNVQTTHPRPGERHQLSVPAPSSVIKGIIGQLGDLVQVAEDEKSEKEAMQTELNRLRRELAVRPEIKSDLVVERIVETVSILMDDDRIMLRGVSDQLAGDLKRVGVGFDGLKSSLDLILSKMQGMSVRPVTLPVRISNEKVREYNSSSSKIGVSNGKLLKAERSVLTVLAQFQKGRTKNQLAIQSGYAVRGGGFNNAIGKLRSSRLIVNLGRGGKEFGITEGGLAALGTWETLPDPGDHLIKYWMGELPKAERSVLSALLRYYPATLSKENLALEAGYEHSGGGFNNALGKLRTLELIEGRGEMILSKSLFGG